MTTEITFIHDNKIFAVAKVSELRTAGWIDEYHVYRAGRRVAQYDYNKYSIAEAFDTCDALAKYA